MDDLALVHDLYAAFAAGDLPRLLGHLHPEVRWNEAEGFPLADRNPYVGPDAIVSGVFARVGELWDGFTVHIGEVVGGPGVVTMLGRYRATAKRSGRRLDAQVAHTWWIENGRVVRFQQMVDTAAVRANLA